MESSDSNESDRDEEQMSQNTNSNSASVIVAGPTRVTGSRVIKFGYRISSERSATDGVQGVGTAASAFRTK